MLCLILSFNVCVVGRNEVVLRVYGSTLWTQVDGVRERWREDIQPLQCRVTLYLCVCVFRRLSVTIDAYCIFLTKCFFKFYDLSFICEVTKKHNKTIGTIVIGTDNLLLGCIFLVCNNCIKLENPWHHQTFFFFFLHPFFFLIHRECFIGFWIHSAATIIELHLKISERVPEAAM